MTIEQSLLAIHGYPIPRPLVLNALEGAELDPTDDMTASIRKSKAYKQCMIKVYQFLSTAPNVSQGGISYSFSAEDKAYFKRMASSIADEIGDNTGRVEYGYQGDSF